MRAEVTAFCREEALFSPSEEVCCAVSGGADSMALLWCLHTMQEDLDIRVSAAHFNHKLRGEEAERDEAFVREFCHAHSIPLHVGSEDVAAYAKAKGLGIEEAARLCRYRFFDSLDCKIATAHHADDNAETILLHLLRGSGLRGLCGIAPKRGSIVRPLLCVSRAQILEFLRAEGIAWVEDSSNLSHEYTRNRLRHELMPLMRRENPRLSEQLTSQSRLLRAEDALLEDYAEALLQRCRRGEGYAVAPLLQAPDALQKRALRRIVRELLPQDVSLVHIEALQALLRNPNPSAKLSLPHGVTAQRCHDTFHLCHEIPLSFPETALRIPGETVISSAGWCIRCKIVKIFENFANTPFHFAVKYDMISQTDIFVRAGQSRDSIAMPNGGRRMLKRLWIDCRIPIQERKLLPVFTDGQSVFAAAGIGVDPAYAAAMGQPALLIHIQRRGDIL